jgi:hypothetical protein
MKNLAYLLLSIATAACVDSAPEDGIDDAFLDDGKADTGGITDGSPEALAALRVANEKSATQLTDHGVSSMAAKNIVAVRKGDDTSSAADDVTFTSLAQLDAVPYVGPIAFARLVAYANELGYLSPTPPPPYTPANKWHVAACPKITFAQLVAKFGSGETKLDFQRPYSTASRTRECNSVTGCKPWQDGASLVIYDDPHDRAAVMPSATRGNATMLLDPDNPSIEIYFGVDHWYAPNDFDFWCDDSPNATAPVQCKVKVGGAHANFFPAKTYDGPLLIDGRICADGTYHFISKVPGDLSQDRMNLNQVALWGQLF